MSDTTSPPSVHLHPLSSSSSMSSTDSAPQSEPTSDEQPDLGAFTTVLRAWTHLQPPPRIPVQIHSPTTSTTTTFQPDQSVVDSDLQSTSHALLLSSSRPPSSSVLHEDSTICSHAPPPSPSSFTRPPSSSVPEESTVWNHAPIASYLYSATPSMTPSIDHEDENSVASTEGGRTVEINSELSFDDHSSSVSSQHPYLDVAVPVALEPSFQSDSSVLTSHFRSTSRNPLPSSNTVSYTSNLSLLSYQIPESTIHQESDHGLLVEIHSTTVPTATSSASLMVPNLNSNSITTPTFGPPLAVPALPFQQEQHRTVLIHPPTQTISDDASVSHLSLPPPSDSPLPPIPTNSHSNPNPHPYLPQQKPSPASLPLPQLPKLDISTSISSFSRAVGGGGQGTIVVDDLRTPDQTPELVLVVKRGGSDGGFRPVDDDCEEEVGEKRTRAYGLGFGFGQGQGQKHVSGYTSNYEGSRSSFRARKPPEMRGRSTRLEPQNEDNEGSNFNSDVAEHRHYDDGDQDIDEEREEGDDYPFPHYRRRGRFHSQTHTPRYYGLTHTPPTGVLPNQPPPQLQSMGQGQAQSSVEVLRGLAYPRPRAYVDPHQEFYSHHPDPHSYPSPYPRPRARPYAQDRDRDIYSSHSSHSPMSSLPSSPAFSHIEPSPIQRDYVLIQPQTPLSVPTQLQSFSQQPQPQQTRPETQLQQSQAQAPNSYLSTQNQGSIICSSATALSPVPVPVSVPSSSAVVSIPPSVPVLASSSSSLSSNLYQGQDAVTSEDHNDSPLLLLPNKHGLPPPSPPSASSSSASLSKTVEKALKADKTGITEKTDKPGKLDKPDKSQRASWECVDLGDDLVAVSVSERSSNVGVGRESVVGMGSSGLNVGSDVGLGLEQPAPKVQQLPSTKQQQPLTKHPSMTQPKQEQRRQLELQFQQSDAQTRLYVESDSDGSEDGAGTTTAGAGASVLVSDIITTTSTTTAPLTTTTTTDSQPPNSTPILHSILNPSPDLDPNPNPKIDPHTNNNNYPKHIHSHSYSQPDSHYHTHYSHPGFHSDSHVAHMEDSTESELDLDLDDDLDHHHVDGGVVDDTVRRVGVGVGGVDVGGDDASLPSLGYLDEALSFIAAERAKWSAAREGCGTSGSGVGAGGSAGVTKGEGGRGKKNFDHDMDTPKRKRRRKRPPRQQQQQPQVLSNSNPGLLEAPIPNTQLLDASHTADEDGGGPSASTSSAKKKKARSSSWSPAKKKHGSNKGKEKEFLIVPPQPPLGSAHPPLLHPAVLVQSERDHLVTGGAGVALPNKPVELFVKQGEDAGQVPTNGSSGVAEDVFGPVNSASINLSGKRGKKMGKRERERVRKDLLIGKSIGKEVVAGKMTSCRPAAAEGVGYEEDDVNEGDNDDDEDDDDDDADAGNLSVEGDSSLNDLSILQPPSSRRDPRRKRKGKDIAHIHSRAGIAGGGAYKSTPGSPKRWREFDDIHVDRESGGGHGHGHDSLGDEDVEDIADGRGGVLHVTPDGSTRKKRNPTKQVKKLVRVRSVPQLRSSAEEPASHAAEEMVTVTPGKTKSKKAKSKAAAASALAPALNDSRIDLLDKDQAQSKRSRLIALAKKLREFFPEQRQELRGVTLRFEKQGVGPKGKGKKAFLTSAGDGGALGQMVPKSMPISVPSVRKSKRNTHHRTGSEGASVGVDDDTIEGEVAVDEDGIREIEEEDEDELDPRGRPPKKSDVLIHVFIDHSNILIGLLSHLKRFSLSHAGSKRTKRGHPLPTIPAKATPTVSMSHVTTSALAFAAVKPTSARPLPNPSSTTSGNGKAGANTSSSSSIPIAVPGSDYHSPIPLPSFATMSRSLPSGSALNEYLVDNDDGSQVEDKGVHSDNYEYHQTEDENLGQITSLGGARKPKEEKKPLKHLWHAALVLLLERGRSVTRRVVVTSSPLYQPMHGIERLGYELRVYVRVPDLGNGMDRERRISGGSKSLQSSPAKPALSSGLPLSAKKRMGHVRHISGSTSAESGGGGGSGNASGGASNLHPYHGIANNTPPQGKIKYREQGVDELLQLKLHQALAATDDVPEGSTIVLATGDGNMGQFNEEGFLGPVRTALRRGWKVELYAWEDGLSRAWRREFGEGTEWGRKGMFRVIGMEQFAGSLVEVIQ